jgi:hypothetical protein
VAIAGVLVYADMVRTNPWSLVLVSATVVWTIGESMGLLDLDPAHFSIWKDVKYVGLAFLGPAWFGVATRFAAKSFWVGLRGTLILIHSGVLFRSPS